MQFEWPDVAKARAPSPCGGTPRGSVTERSQEMPVGTPGPEWASTIFYLFCLVLLLAWLAEYY